MKKDSKVNFFEKCGDELFPLIIGFFLFLLWIVEDFSFSDKIIMTSLILGVEFIFAIGITRDYRETAYS